MALAIPVPVGLVKGTFTGSTTLKSPHTTGVEIASCARSHHESKS